METTLHRVALVKTVSLSVPPTFQTSFFRILQLLGVSVEQKDPGRAASEPSGDREVPKVPVSCPILAPGNSGDGKVLEPVDSRVGEEMSDLASEDAFLKGFRMLQ